MSNKRETHFVNGALCWLIGEEFRVISPRVCEELALCDMPGYSEGWQRKLYGAYVARTLDSYRKAQAGMEYTSEELGEMRAAFGPGTEVVNVLTGKRIKL